MKRHVFHALSASTVIVLAAPLAAQPAAQTPAPVVQPAPTQPADVPAPGNEQSAKPTAAKEKVCTPVLIRAGPNQGQLVSKCHHTDRSKAG